MVIVGYDNGSSGSVSFIKDDQKFFYKTPTKSSLNYQKSKDTYITRVDINKLREIHLQHYVKGNTYALIERPLNNPGLYKASLSAMRALEATLILLEELEIPYAFIDSKNWQKLYLGVDVKGRDNLKAKSKELGQLVFPDFKNDDFDGYFICLYLKEHFEKIFQRE
jgi:hypothetical protein